MPGSPSPERLALDQALFLQALRDIAELKEERAARRREEDLAARRHKSRNAVVLVIIAGIFTLLAALLGAYGSDRLSRSHPPPVPSTEPAPSASHPSASHP
jgi:hypothetical protein